MKGDDLERMSVDELWDLHQQLRQILSGKLSERKRKLEHQLSQLRRDTSRPTDEQGRRRPYPAVKQKYRNPNNPSQTWSGRGKQPRWVSEMMVAGRKLCEFSERK